MKVISVLSSPWSQGRKNVFYVKQNTAGRCERLSHSSVTTSGQSAVKLCPCRSILRIDGVENIEFIYLFSRGLTDGSGNKEEVEDAELFCDGKININILKTWHEHHQWQTPESIMQLICSPAVLCRPELSSVINLRTYLQCKWLKSCQIILNSVN